MLRRFLGCALVLIILASSVSVSGAAQQGTRLLRQPDLSADHVVFTYGADVWIADRSGGDARRLTSTPAVESNPHFSPDGQTVAFSSNRSGSFAVYTVPTHGGMPRRLTWHPSGSMVRGWTPDGDRVLYTSSRDTAPVGYGRLWTVSADGGPSELLPSPMGNDGSYAPDGDRMIVDPTSRWDVEWRHYRGGQNQALRILDLDSLSETKIPNQRTTDIHPAWMGDTIYFLSDREWTMNVWSYDPDDSSLNRLTDFDGTDVKWLAAHEGTLVIEQAGWLHLVDADSGRANRLDITVRGDFPWAATKWEDVSQQAGSGRLSPTGQRAVFQARGEIFTVPVENGDSRNLTRSSGVADRTPIWSPDGADVAWFADVDGGYSLRIASQDGMGDARDISIGESKLGWEPTWSPDGKHIAFVDDDVRVRVVDVEGGTIQTIDTGGTNLERGSMGLTWSPDSKWLAYAKTFANNFRRIVVWSAEDGNLAPVTDTMADSVRPAWDRDGRHLYFLASTNLALRSGWANTSSIQASAPTYAAYVTILRSDDPSPFPPQSDEEPEPEPEPEEEQEAEAEEEPEVPDESEAPGEEAEESDEGVRIDFDGIERRIIALPMPVRNYSSMVAGPEGSVFIGEFAAGQPGLTIHKFTLADREASEFATRASTPTVSNDGSKMLFRSGPAGRVVGTGRPPAPGSGMLNLNLRTRLDRMAEWRQIFHEAWRYERDYFYDPGMHGRDWELVRQRYAPLVPYVRHRADLTYLLDQVNGEMSVGHSFVFGGDTPATDRSSVGLLGADLAADSGRWQIDRIYTLESWNPGLSAPLDRPGLGVDEGEYLVGVDGMELTANQDPYELLDGTAGRQTVLHINSDPSMDGAREVIVEPIRSENQLRQRAWVEDNRRRVDELSDGKLAYIWVPNTGGGVWTFDRYFFAQQDKLGAVVDERFNGGGLLDDYMVDLMTRELRAAITNEVPNGAPIRLPAGILGPKALLINEYAGSGGDFFPWIFRQQRAGKLIGKRTWGGLVKSSVHYALADGGALTAPDNAVFDPLEEVWVGENIGVPPDIEVEMDARSVAAGGDPQLERAVQEVLSELEETAPITPPAFPRPTRRDGQR
ncbi:MAG: protease [Acidobacteria bacterium]|nr:protease [Acidobacteriota bacterium]